MTMNIKPAEGKLGVLCVGLGAVTTTFIIIEQLEKSTPLRKEVH